MCYIDNCERMNNSTLTKNDNKTTIKKRIILISGKRSSGKDTFATILNDYFSSLKLRVKSMAFAFATKVGYCKKNNLDLDKMLNDYVYKESHRSGLLDYFLTNGDFNWYADYVYKFIEQEYDNFDVFIIHDLRIKQHMTFFETLCNQTSFNSKYNCIFIRVNASKESKIKRGWIEKPYDSDFTETDLDDNECFDLYIKNDGNIDDLKKYMDNLS